MSTRLELGREAVPTLPQGVELRFDPAEKAWTVSVPARVVMPDDITIELLKRCDGKTPISTIVDDLAQAFSANPGQLASDIDTMLQDLTDQGLIEVQLDIEL